MLVKPPKMRTSEINISYWNVINLNIIPKTNSIILRIINIVDEYLWASSQLNCDALDSLVLYPYKKFIFLGLNNLKKHLLQIIK